MAKPTVRTQRIVTLPEISHNGTVDTLTLVELGDGKVEVLIGETQLFICLRVDLVAALDLLK
jgi:hypothetical protein